MTNELFEWEPPRSGAAVIPFPLSRCVGKARVTAAVVLRCKSQTTQQAAFDRVALALARRLQSAGIDPTEVALQVRAFAGAVNAVLANWEARQQA